MDLRNVLKSPIIYTTYQKIVGGYRARRKFVEDYLDVKPEEYLLDFGCGPGDILDFLPDVKYTGVDIDPIYIKKAEEKYGNRGTFVCSDLQDLKLTETISFDYIIATGVLHHMTDDECDYFLKWSRALLKTNGKLITMDGCYITNQNKISKYLLDKDRGKYVRTVEAYKSLATNYFSEVDCHIDESYFHVPYTSLIMECKNI